MGKNFEEVYICDLGIAKIKEFSDLTMTCQEKGPETFPYMAPEMFKVSRRGAAVDIYSLGCIELFGQKRVWQGLDGPSIMHAACSWIKASPTPKSFNTSPPR